MRIALLKVWDSSERGAVLKDLMKLSCKYTDSDGVMETIRDSETSFVKVYSSAQAIADFSVALKIKRNDSYCQLPFCHTVEAEAMGGQIRTGDETAGDRAGKLVYDSLEQLFDIHFDYTVCRIRNMIEACRILKNRGEIVVYNVNGPFSILNCLIDTTLLFKVWRKDQSKVRLLFDNLRSELLQYIDKICAAGADCISFADPVGTPKILGPHCAKSVTEIFTVPFLKSAQLVCKNRTNIYLCPMTVGALDAFSYVEYKDVDINPSQGILIHGCIKNMPKKQITLQFKL